MTPDLRAALRLVIEAHPVGSTVPLLREHALELLGEPAERIQPSALPPADLTAAELAARVQRNPSTVRAWLEAGRIEGAYLDSSRRWRIPVSSVLAFEAAERTGKPSSPTPRRRPLPLSAWRTAS